MNSPTPTLSPQLSFFCKVAVDLFVGEAIQAGANGNAQTLYQHAQTAVELAEGFAEITASDPEDVTNGLSTVETALDNAIGSGVNPAVTLALSNAIAFINTKAVAFAAAFSGSAGQAFASQIAAGVVAEVQKLAANYPQPTPVTQKAA